MKIINIVGARPNFMKMAPLVRAFDAVEGLEQLLVHTGQHYDAGLSDVFFRELGIPAPDISLGVGSLPRPEQIARIEESFEPVVVSEKPDVVLVVGDVNSTVACARVARRHGVKVAHVEAGLRSFDLEMPEEHNRVETDQLSDFLYVTEEAGLRNLANEKITGEALLVGNVMIDTLVHDLPKARSSMKSKELGLSEGEFIVSTFHRPSNVDTAAGLESILDIIRTITARSAMVLPLHPRTKASYERFGMLEQLRGLPQLVLCEPLGYVDFMGLVCRAKAVVTDSGGIQEETTYLGVPCLTMRENTERPSTVELGTNIIVGSDRDLLRTELDNIHKGTFKKGSVPPLWDGKSAERIAAHLKQRLS